MPPGGSTRVGILPDCPSIYRGEVEMRQRSGSNHEPPGHTVAPFRFLAAMPPEGSTRAGILPGCPSLDRGSREAVVGFEPRTFWSVNWCSNHLVQLAPSYGNSNISVGTDASLPYNHKVRPYILYIYNYTKSPTVKRREWSGKKLIARTPRTSISAISCNVSNQAQTGSRGPHPGRRTAPTTPKLFVISFMPFCQVMCCPPRGLCDPEGGTEDNTRLARWNFRGGEMAQWLEREITHRKVRGSNPTSASRLPLSGQYSVPRAFFGWHDIRKRGLKYSQVAQAWMEAVEMPRLGSKTMELLSLGSHPNH
ncbi:hypothetical protein T265_05881 [Opisthorchis viverrini]|uniref:Uncharacterized protein n=1 Tax=Opisthorchis viverrini TaxID=6198 RepID=A0A075AER1_OPIVI|nr:hypothetical protein T265_05881 [Opisthorchis viverrini]KER26974.1 hypothetical protein T265_05881 [Opisthorchis viverrini]